MKLTKAIGCAALVAPILFTQPATAQPLSTSQSIRCARHIELGTIYALREADSLAEAQYLAALDIDPDNSAALNNLGNLAFLNGDLDNAIAFYKRATSVSIGDGGVNLNLGLLSYVAGDDLTGLSELGIGIQKIGSLHEAADLLGLWDADTTAIRGDKKLIDKAALQRMLEKAKNKVPPVRADSLAASEKKPQRIVSRRAGVKGNDLKDLRKLLYWKLASSTIGSAHAPSDHH